MRRICFLLIALASTPLPFACAQDAATEERLNRLSGKIDDIIASQGELDKRMTALTRELAEMREQIGKPNNSYVTQDELKRLAEAVKEVDRKRLDDDEKVRAELQKLGKIAATPPPAPRRTTPSAPQTESSGPEKPGQSEKGFTYKVQQGDNLSTIAQAYRQKNIKVTVEQILKANPKLVPEKMRVGQEIFIPAPAESSQ